MDEKLKKLLEQRGNLFDKMQGLTNKADAEKRDFTETEDKEFSSMEQEYKGIQDSIRRHELLSDMRAENQKPEETIYEKAGNDEVELRKKNKTVEPPKVWESLGDQLNAIVRAGMGNGIDKRLIPESRSATGLNETNPSDGGFLIQHDFAAELLKNAYDRGFLASRVRRLPLSAQSTGITINAIDESSRATGSRMGGIQIYWASEAATVSPTKPKFRQISLNVHKLMGLCYATDEMLADSVALESIINEGFADEFAFVLDDSILRGTGKGQPLGLLGHASEVTVAKESGQATASIVKENIVKMRSRLYAKGRSNSVWLVNQDVEPQLNLLTLGDLGIYFPAGSFANQPEDRLMGRPVQAIEHCETLGTKGDIILVDPSQYVMIDKGELRTQSSLHVRFLYDEQVFKFTYRVDGQPIWNKAVTPYKGSNTVSPFVTLATRG